MAVPHVNPLDLITDAWANAIADAINANSDALAAINAKGIPKVFGATGTSLTTWSALTTLTTLNVPAQTVAGILWVTMDIRIDATATDGQIEIHTKNNGVSVGRRFLLGGAIYQTALTSRIVTSIGVANAITTTGQRIGGTGTCNTYNEPTDANRINALWFPS